MKKIPMIQISNSESMKRSWRGILFTMGLILGSFSLFGQENEKTATIQASLQSFRVEKGLEIQRVAAEPLVASPIAMSFDSQGRLWVVEHRGPLRLKSSERKGKGQGAVVRLEDSDQDGVLDQRVEFLDKLDSATSVLPFLDGILVGDPPLLQFWRDTDGDGKADHAETLCEDFIHVSDPEAELLQQPNGLIWARDNWIHAAGLSKKFKRINGKWIAEVKEVRGQWGLAQDDAGRWYYVGEDQKLRVDLLPSEWVTQGDEPHELRGSVGQELLSSQQVWPWKEGRHKENAPSADDFHFNFGASPLVYRAAHLPLDFYGSVFVCDPSLHLVRRNALIFGRDHIEGKNALAKQEFLVSSEPKFQPLHLQLGPEGALYIVDWHGDVWESASVSKSSRDMGRIYRVRSKDQKVIDTYRPQTDREWVGYLGHANAFYRSFAQQILVNSEDETLEEDLRVAMQSQENLIRRLYALWVLEGRNSLSVKDLQPLCFDVDFKIRSSAVSLLGKYAKAEGPQREEALKLLLRLPQESSSDTLVHRMLMLGQFDDATALQGKVKLLATYPKETRLLEAFLTFPDSAQHVALLKEVVHSKKTFQKPSELQFKVILKLTERIFHHRERSEVDAWVNLAMELSDENHKKRAIKPEARAMQNAFKTWLETEERAIELSKRPPQWDTFLKMLGEKHHSLAVTKIQFTEG